MGNFWQVGPEPLLKALQKMRICRSASIAESLAVMCRSSLCPTTATSLSRQKVLEIEVLCPGVRLIFRYCPLLI